MDIISEVVYHLLQCMIYLQWDKQFLHMYTKIFVELWHSILVKITLHYKYLNYMLVNKNLGGSKNGKFIIKKRLQSVS